MADWLLALAVVLPAGVIVFHYGRVYERGNGEPEPCRRKHRDEL